MRTNPVDGMCAELPESAPWWDTSKVTNMDLAFVVEREEKSKEREAVTGEFTEFNADLSKWDVSSVTSMRDMFSDCRDFEGVGLERWNRRVETMGNLSKLRDVRDGRFRLEGATETPMKDAVKGAVAFQERLCANETGGGRYVEHVCAKRIDRFEFRRRRRRRRKKEKLPLTDETFHNAIEECLQSNPIGGMCKGSEYGIMPDWDVSRVTDMSKAFYDMWDFNGDLSKWDVKNLKNAQEMFYGADTFNADISKWNTQNLQNCQDMFHDAKVLIDPSTIGRRIR